MYSINLRFGNWMLNLSAHSKCLWSCSIYFDRYFWTSYVVKFHIWPRWKYLNSFKMIWTRSKIFWLSRCKIDWVWVELTEAVKAFQKWVSNLHFFLYLGQFLTDFQNSFFLWKLVKIAIWIKIGCSVAHSAQPLPLPLQK